MNDLVLSEEVLSPSMCPKSSSPQNNNQIIGMKDPMINNTSCKITAIDMDVTPPKILLKRCDNSKKETNDAKKGRKEIDEKKMEKSKQQEKQGPVDKVEIKPGDIVEGDIKILSVSFTRLTMKLLHP
eukprot:3175516-Ditylum_brightwellii.AAC.1